MTTLSDGRLKVQHWPIERLTPYPNNPRKNDHAVDQMAEAIREFGFRIPVVAKSDGEVVDGHLRLKAAIALGMKSIPVALADNLTDAQVRAFRLLANRSGTWAEWDFDLLEAELQKLKIEDFDLKLTGFDDNELAKMLAPEGNTDPDDAPDVEATVISKPGDLWLLGRHRLLCGDCTDAATVARALGDAKPCLIVTSPPYNQKIDGFKPSGMHKEHGWVRKVGRLAYQDDILESDYQDRQRALLAQWHEMLSNGGAVFYNHKNRYREKRVLSPYEWLPGPFSLRQEIVWSRPGSVTQNARMFLPSDERIFWLYKGENFTFNATTEIKSWSSVWDISPRANLDHAVAFPVEIPSRCIRATTNAGDVVYEPFSGSGTTIIAAEMTGRNCIALEIAPQYVDVAVRRWQAFTGQAATLDGDGRIFAEIERERAP